MDSFFKLLSRWFCKHSYSRCCNTPNELPPFEKTSPSHVFERNFTQNSLSKDKSIGMESLWAGRSYPGHLRKTITMTHIHPPPLKTCNKCKWKTSLWHHKHHICLKLWETPTLTKTWFIWTPFLDFGITGPKSTQNTQTPHQTSLEVVLSACTIEWSFFSPLATVKKLTKQLENDGVYSSFGMCFMI